MTSVAPASEDGRTQRSLRRPASTGAKGVALTGAASRSYNLASVWEQTAGLPAEVQEVVDLLGSQCQVKPMPKHVRRSSTDGGGGGGGLLPEAAAAAAAGAALEEGDVGTEEGANGGRLVLGTANQFYRWHSEVQAARTQASEAKYTEYVDTLTSRIRACDSVSHAVDDTLAVLDTITAHHQAIRDKIQGLSNSCQRLVQEKDRLVEFADEVRDKLAFFEELDGIQQQFFASASFVESPDFLPLLKRLDEGVSFVSAHADYHESQVYVGKFKQLQSRAMGMIRFKAHQVFRNAARTVQHSLFAQSQQAREAAAKEATAGSTSAGGGAAGAANGGLDRMSSGGVTAADLFLPDGSETSLLYVRFRSAAEPALKGLLSEMEARAARPEYARLLEDCHGMYCSVRQQLVGVVVQYRISGMDWSSLPALLRSGFTYLMQVCRQEHKLFNTFFPASARQGPAALVPLMEALATILYDAVRPVFLQISDVEELCGLIDIMQQELLADDAEADDAVQALRPMMSSTLHDLQERLIYRIQFHVREYVSGYVIQPEDVDFPKKLLEAREQLLQRQAAAAADSSSQDAGEARGEEAPEEEELEEEGLEEWYPPLRHTLGSLHRLYRSVAVGVFGPLAQELVADCTASLAQASTRVAQQTGVLDGQLFLIRHLLMLREQIAPFQADFAVMQRELNFSHMRDHVRRVLGGSTPLLSIGKDSMIAGLTPRVVESRVDSKKELERSLKATCEAFIMAVTKLTVEPMLSFITKVTAVYYAGAPPGAAVPAGRKPLKEQVFATPEKVQGMVEAVNQLMRSALPDAVTKLQLYLPSSSTQGILFKPIKANIAEAHAQISRLLDAEYAEHRDSVPLMRPQDLAAHLDSLC